MYFAPQDDDNLVAPVKATTKTGAANSASADAAAGNGATAMTTTAEPSRSARMDLQIHPRNAEQDMGELFAGQSLIPEPPKQQAALVKRKPEPPPAPQAPPLPFQFLGRMIDNGDVAYFLQLNNKNIVMRIGDSIDRTYTLEAASAGALHFIYLPLNQKQSLVVGEVN